MAPSSRSSRRAATRAVAQLLVIAAAALALAASGCGDGGGEEAGAESTAFAAALETIGGGIEPSGTGFGWIDVAAVEEAGGRGSVLEVAAALGPGAGSLVRDSGEIARRTGLDPLAASRLLSNTGSYALALRVDGAPPGDLRELIEGAGGRRLTVKDVTAYDLGRLWSQRQITGPLSPLEAYASRTAFPADAVVLARVDSARAGMVDDDETPLSEPRIALAAECLGDVVAARTLPGGLTYNKAAAPELIAVGSDGGGRAVICAVGSSAADAEERAAALEASVGSGAADPVTDEPLSRSVDSAEIGTLEGDGAYAARADLTLTSETPASFIFAALDRGSVLTYLGAPAPIP